MTTDSKDSAVDGGTQGSQPEGSKVPSGQQGSSAEYVTVAEFKKIQQSLDALSRAMQSDKDRAVKKTNQRLEGVEATLREALQGYQQKGQTDIKDVLADLEQQEEAETRAVLRELAHSFKSGNLSTPSSSGTEQPSGVDVSGIVKELELDANDLRVREFAAKKFASAAEAYRDAAKLAKTIATTQPTDADMPSEVARQRQQTPSNQDALKAEYEEGSKNLRGQELVNYKMAMRKKGLRVS